MALFEEEQITDTLDTGIPSIKYEGNEGPQDPRKEQMLAQLKEEYMQYVFEQKEIDQPIMSFEEWYQSVYQASKMGVQAPQEEMGMQEEMMMREPAAYGGIMDTESGRRAYGLGSIFKKLKRIPKKLFKGVKKIAKSPMGKMGIAALLMGPAMGAFGGSGAAGSGFLPSGAAGGASLAKIPWYKKGLMKGITGVAGKAMKMNPKTLAKIGIGAASALPLLGIGTKAKQDEIENFSQSGDWDENFKTAGGFPGMRRAIARAKDQQELEGLSDQFGFTPGLFPQVAADGGRIGYAGGEMVEKIKEGIIEGGKGVAAPFIDESIWLEKIKDFIKPGGVDAIEKIKEGIIEGGDRGMGIPGVDEAIWIEKIKEFIRKKRGEGRPDPRDQLRPGSSLPEELESWENFPGQPLRPDFRRPMRPMPDKPRRRGYALGSKADFAIEDVMTGGVEDEIGGITGIMRQADLHRKGNIGQFYAAEGGSPSEGGIMDLGGMEKDYRNTGGFVELGAEEKADDVPARLSKNEFVMTADAVRGAGDGDIDKGASIMENMMKGLEEKGQQAGGGERGWKAQLLAEEFAQDRYGKEFYDLSPVIQMELYNEALDYVDSGGYSQKQGAEDMFEVSERLSEVV